MAVKLLWTPKARADIKKIFVEIGQEQPQAAERYFQQFRYKAGLLIDHPRLGERHPESSVRRGCSSKHRM
ncbi:type II toxin-antitoxin system RelE/ParE family toxin [Rhizobium leguminosarum]|uniref:type II toxin-antitoxin system RelE/ParE family toxin n=1 Tax=Rhizobium leguminosarum TaxID=384 RepID=UPI003D010F77